MAKKEEKTMSVVTLPLKTEPWQADRLTKLMENCRAIYNVVLGQAWREYCKVIADPEYAAAAAVYGEFKKACEEENKAENKAGKKSGSNGDKKAPKKKPPEVVAALDTMNRMRAEKNLTEYGIGNMVTYHRQHYSTSVSSMVANRSIAAPIWAALHKVIFDDGKEVHFKGKGELESVASDGKSGIRLVDADGETLFCGTPFAPMFLAVSSRGGKKMQIPVAVPKNDAYKVRMTARKFSVVRIVKKTVRGTDKFYVQLTVEGTPEPKLDKYGNDKHVRGKGKVGVYIDTRTVTVAAADGEIIKTYKLNEGIDHFEQEKIRLNQYMSHSRLLNNPDNFDEDGTIKKGVVVDGIRRRLKWHNSNKYYKAKDAKKDLFRVERETRRLERIRIANEILSLGNDIYINEFPFADAAKRKTEDKLKADGTPASKAKAGKAIGENAPGVLVTLLRNKIESTGEGRVTELAIEAPKERRKGYREEYALTFLRDGDKMVTIKKEKEQ